MIRPLIREILETAGAVPKKNALIWEGNRISYSELKGKILSAAIALRDLGIAKGDRVILSADHRPSFVYGYFACHLLEAIAVPIDPQMNRKHLDFVIHQTEPRVAFLSASQAAGMTAKSLDVLDCPTRDADDPAGVSAELDAIADLIFTSGSTGTPKGVVLTHRNIVAAARNINQFIGNTSEDVELVPLPLSHSFGLGRLRCNMLVGGTLVLTDGFLKPDKLFHAFEEHHPTGFSCVPAGLAILLHLSGNKLGYYHSQLKYIEIGSAPMPYEQKLRLMKLLPNTHICMHYGLTEASRSAFIEFHASKNKLQSVGKASPNVEIEIVDSNLNIVGVNQIGQIRVRSEALMKGYWKDLDRTTKALVNGWLLTGDLGYKDQDGYLYLKGRADEMINVGGLKVSPVEIEEVLKTHVAVQDCACVGVADPTGLRGQNIKAYLVRRHPSTAPPTPEELVQFLTTKLEPYKIPTSYEWIAEIPKTGSGKIQRLSLAGKFK